MTTRQCFSRKTLERMDSCPDCATRTPERSHDANCSAHAPTQWQRLASLARGGLFLQGCPSRPLSAALAVGHMLPAAAATPIKLVAEPWRELIERV